MSFPLHETLRPVVLIADDDPTIRLLVREALEPTGFQVEEAEDGAQALDILKIMRADLILLDVTMPKKNGFEVCSALRNSPQYASLPILMVTGHDDVESVTQAFEAGSTDFLTKPINWELLPYRVRYLLRASWEEKERKRAQDEVLRLNQQTELLLNSAGEGICGLDLNGRITFVNSAAIEITGWDPSDVIGQLIHSVFNHSKPDGTPYSIAEHPVYESLLNSVVNRQSDEVFWKKDGTSFFVEYVCTPTMLGGKVTGAVVVFRDITSRRMMEKRQEAQYRITSILAESSTLDQAAPKILESICKTLDWPLGLFWQADSANQVLVLKEFWVPSSTGSSRFGDLTEEITLAQGTGLAGRIWLTGKAGWSSDASPPQDSLKFLGITELGLRSAFGFPIRDKEQVLGVVEFFSYKSDQPDGEWMNLFNAIGSQIGQFIERKQAKEALQESQARLAQAQRIARLGHWHLDLSRSILKISEEMFQILGKTSQEFSGTQEEFLALIHPDDREERKQSIQRALTERRPFSHEYRIKGPAEEELIVVEHGEFVFDQSGKPIQIIGTIQDVTEMKLKDYQIHTLAHYDILTKLPNRILFQDLLEKALAASRRSNKLVAVLLLNMDRFARINETLGHSVGDQILREAAKRLLKSVRRSDSVARHQMADDSTTVSRFGGDEFTILLTDIKSADDPAKIARRISSRLGQPFTVGTQEIFVTASIGISLFPGDGGNEDDLLKTAHIAMQHAKEAGRNTYHYFSPNMNVTSFARLAMENSLYKAIERSEFVLHYQPLIDIPRWEIIGVEALIRWNHPDLGMISPTDFIPLAEESGLIKSIGEWALQTACAHHKAWLERGLPPIRIGVNLSSLQFRDQDLIATIENALQMGGLAPQYLELELTEGVIMRDVETTIGILQYLKNLGISIAIDDFGTGYSSLNYLKRLPINTLKIDRSFVMDLTSESNDVSITKAIIAMAHSLNLRVIAEGVETEGQLKHLRELGCDEFQGFLFSPAVPSEELVRIFQSHHSRTGEITVGPASATHQ